MKAWKTVTALLLLVLLLAEGIPEPAMAAEEREEPLFGEFESVELVSGEPVDQTVFEEYTLIMVNIWGTFCSPCIGEMPDLAKLGRDYADKGFAVIGIPQDITNKNGKIKKNRMEDALLIVEQTEADYLHIVPTKALYEAKLRLCQALPETVFLNAEGVQIGESYLGAKSYDEWSEIIEELLEGLA